MQALYLTTEEQKIFAGLASEVGEGWLVEHEGAIASDSPIGMRTRMALLELEDPAIAAIQRAAEEGGDMDALAALIQATNISSASEGDLAELFFALGPVRLTSLIVYLLMKVSSDADLDDISILTNIRHSLLTAMHGL